TGTPHADALAEMTPRMADPALTPSGRVMALLLESGEDFIDVMQDIARKQAESLQAAPMDRSREEQLEQLVEASHQQQVQIEESDQCDFPTFLADYFERAR